jgi:hypothetical protein
LIPALLVHSVLWIGTGKTSSFPTGSRSHIESSLAVLASLSSPVAQVSSLPGQHLAAIFLIVLCQSSLVLVFPIGFCSARFHFASLRWLFSRRVVSSFSARSFHQLNFQFLLEEPLLFYLDSRVLGKTLSRWIIDLILELPNQKARGFLVLIALKW